MSYINCPNCDKETFAAFSSCTHCGFFLSPPTKCGKQSNQEGAASRLCVKSSCSDANITEADTYMSDGKLITVILIILLVLAGNVFLLVKGCEGSTSSRNTSGINNRNWQTRDNREEAYYQMKQFVTQRLRSPGSADFPTYFTRGDDHVKKSGTTYTVTSYVDSQNAFGGSVRTSFSGKIQQIDKLEWKLITLDLN